MTALTGYAHPAYAQSLAAHGQPLQLACSGGWVIERQIPGFPDRDAMGPYPLFLCRDWSSVAADLEVMGERWVSLSLVADPFGSYSPALLQQTFRDVARPYKEHYIVDLSRNPAGFVAPHHRRNARKALQAVRVERCDSPLHLLEEWTALYIGLIHRHDIRGIPAFSREGFSWQLRTPGAVTFRATSGETVVGMTLWYVVGEVGYYHLGASSPEGYRLRASFALFWHALEHFASAGLRWLDLGAGAGVLNQGDDGLTRFKRGWATGTRPAFFCGRVFKRERYVQMAQLKGQIQAQYFPAYRAGEFT